METIGAYLTRMLHLRGLTPTQLAERCGLANGYVSRLCNSTSANLQVSTIKKLAAGLDVNPHEIFTIISGTPVSEATAVNHHLLLNLYGRLVDEPVGVDLLRQILATPPDQRQAVLGYLAHNGEAPP